MSNIIPPLLCDSPPPLDVEEDEDDFGDFTTAGDLSYPGDIAFSLPTTPQRTPLKSDFFKPISPILNENDFKREPSEIKLCNGLNELIVEKDHQDKRKCDTPEDEAKEPPVLLDTSERSSEENRRNSEPESCETKSLSSVENDSDSNVVLNDSVNIGENSKSDAKTDADDDDFQDFQDVSKECSSEDVLEDCLPDVGENGEAEESGIEEIEDEEVVEDVQEKEEIRANAEISEEFDSGKKFVPEDLKLDTLQNESEEIKDRTDEKLEEVEVETDCKPELAEEQKEEENDDFDADFDDFQAGAPIPTEEIKPVETVQAESDDDFGDFDDYSKQANFPVVSMSMSAEETSAKAAKIIKDMFPDGGKSEEDYKAEDFVTNNSIFKGVKDIELTNALTYQWSNSESQKMLLKSLNIDRRNILYGPAWNPSMPRFAANLSFAPLEPIKSELPAKNLSPSNSPPADQPPETPESQFDWPQPDANTINVLPQSGSLLLDLEHIVSTLDTAHSPVCTNAHSPIDNDSWDTWLQTLTPPEEEQTQQHQSSTCLTINQPTIAEDPPINQPPSFSIPQEIDIPPPTLQSSFSVVQGDNESVKSLKFTTDLTNECEPKESDDGYDEFTSYKSATEEPSYSAWSSSVPLRETHISNVPPETKPSEEPEEDDFSAFQMSAPPPVKSAPVLLQPTVPLEPLKPTVLSTAPAKIEWPEPGITSDDITNLELSLVTLKVASDNSTSSPVAAATKSAQRAERVELKEEDDWSDFVSNQDVGNGRRAELPQPQLQQFAVSRPPSLKIAPNNLEREFAVQQGPPLIDPLEQFNRIHRQAASANGYKAQAQPAKSESDEDWTEFVSSPAVPTISNGWSKPVQQPKISLDWSKPPQFTSWSTNITPNIITNPVHFDLLPQSYAQPGCSSAAASHDIFAKRASGNKKPTGSVNKSNIPSISALPDLDFIAPRTRTFPKK